MQSRTGRKVWLALCAALLGCSSVVDFDRDLIGKDAGGGGTGGGGMDAMVGDSSVIKPDGTVPVVDTGVPVPDCKTNTECEPNELCCSEKCVATSATAGCEECGVQCSIAADTCTGRLCTCGTAASCSGSTPFCAAANAGEDHSCLQCRGDADCAERTDDKMQCVGGECAECDTADGNSGCSNPTPICAADACIGCDATHACTGGMQCVDGACYGCDDATNTGCDPNGTTPICEPAPQGGLFQCVGCTNDGQCAGNTNGGQCVAGSCEQCDPTAGQNNAGCNANSAAPICDVGAKTCRACASGDCTSGTCSESGATAGRCVGCTESSQCGRSDVATPFCDPADGTCKACSAAGNANQSDAFCAGESAARPACDTSGRCVPCIAPARGCGAGNQCLVNVAPQLNSCVDCLNNSGCSAPNDICHVASHRCIDCDGTGGCESGQCRVVAADPTMNSCVACQVDNDCGTGATPLCQNNTCVACTAAGAAANTRCAARTTTGVGDICVTEGAAAGTCGECNPTAMHLGCDANQLCCVSSGTTRCEATSSATQCAACGTACTSGQVCLTGGRSCVGCNGPTDCPTNTPFCMANACRVCMSDAECAAANASTPACTSMGACAPFTPCTIVGVDPVCAADTRHPTCGANLLCQAPPI